MVPKFSKSKMGRTLGYCAPLLWNQHPVWGQETNILSGFKIRLKSLLFGEAHS